MAINSNSVKRTGWAVATLALLGLAVVLGSDGLTKLTSKGRAAVKSVVG